jgi:hypothetical protein
MGGLWENAARGRYEKGGTGVPPQFHSFREGRLSLFVAVLPAHFFALVAVDFGFPFLLDA